MKLLPPRLSLGARINRAIRYLLRLVIYVIIGASLLAIPFFAHFIVKADREVTPQFENRRWALPARVYARPLDLYVGALVKKEDMIFELENIHYRTTSRLNQPGTYRVIDNTVEVYTRAFAYSDGFEPSQKIKVTFNGGKISAVESQESSEKITHIRLEPMLIASIYPTHNEDRILLKREEIPPILIDALLAMEDRQFYQHIGVNPKAILRAMVANMQAGKTVQGGSTLTQQLIKNYFLTSAKSLERKIQEMFYALVVDWRFSKDDILEAYINEIYLGQDGDRAIHGFGLASEFFFGKQVNELSLGEIATLVGVIPSPSSYNPRRNPEVALKRRNLVIDVLALQNLISAEEAEIVKAEPLSILEKAPSGKTKYPSFVNLVHKQLQELYSYDDLTSGGLKIFTSLDPIYQRHAEKAVIDLLPELERFRNQPKDALQAALVISKNETGEVVALVGDRDTTQAGFNRALTAKRPIGSLIKPFIYLRALEEPHRFSLSTPLDDETPFEMYIGGTRWAPNNFDRRLHGWVTLETALAKSYNIPTVRLGLAVGLENIVETLYRLGVSRQENDFKAVPAALLGAIDMSPFEVNQAYSTIANGGYAIPLRAIREVTTLDGEILVRNEVAPVQAVYSGPNYLITRAMQTVVTNGTAGRVRNDIKVKMGAKTGTTNDYRDSWFAGFTGNFTATAWVGRDDNKPTRLTGSTGALRIWGRAMKNLPLESISNERPDDIVYTNVDTSTGLLPPQYSCSNTRVVNMPFVKGYQPTVQGECFDFFDFEDDGFEYDF